MRCYDNAFSGHTLKRPVMSELFRKVLDWFNAQPSGTQSLVTTFIPIGLSAAALTWQVLKTLRDRRIQRKAERAENERLAAAAAELKPEKIGFAEALVAEEEALARLPEFVKSLSQTLTDAVQRQEQIKRKMANFGPSSPNARQRFNSLWLEYADNLTNTTRAFRKQIDPFKKDARVLRECQERYVEWNKLTETPKPNEKWIVGYEATVASRQQLRDLRATIDPAATEKRWDPMARAMNRKLDSAVKDFVKVSGDLASVIDDLEGSCTVMIDAVDEWRRQDQPRSWFARVRQTSTNS